MKPLILLLLALPALAIWSPFGQPVPVDRAVSNLQAHLHESPNDASSWLTLGRLHSYAFFTAEPQVPMRGSKLFIPDIPRSSPPKQPSAESLAHLKESIAAFRKSISLDANQPLAYLGLAWDLEQAAPYASRIGEDAEHLLDHALENYRQAYDHTAKADLEMTALPPGYQAISKEAAEGIISIDQQRNKDAAEIARMKQTIAKISQKPRAVTPVIFSFEETASLGDLVAPEVHVTFDLDGFGDSTWTWLKPSTGILVWDPNHTGIVQSGLQLFGSVTWWMFWRDGFQALAALDDNHDGWLSGNELTGLAVWIDRNQNGRSDPGEVITLEQAGIVRISVSAKVDVDGTLANAHGIQFSDGRRTPSYDWVARSQPELGTKR
jgi:hypothetical protein